MVEIVSTSVGDLWRQTLPPGSRLLAGERSLGREVTWASTLRVRPPAFPNLGPGEMALLSSDWLDLIDPPLGLAQALDGLSQRGAAAVAVMGQVPQDALLRAEALGMPLFDLPDGTNMYELEGSIGRFISRQRALLYQRGADVHRRLMEASIMGKGMPGLLLVLAQGTNQTAALLDQRGRPRHLASPPGTKLTPEGLASALGAGWAKAFKGRPQAAEEAEPPVLDVPISLAGSQAVGCVLALGGHLNGYLLLVASKGEIGPLERLALAQAASVFAAEMAKERAVIEAESRLKGDFLEELLEGELADEEDLTSRAEHLGYNVAGPTVVVVVGIEQDHRPRAGAREMGAVLAQRLMEITPAGTAAMGRGEEAVVVLPLADSREQQEPGARAETLRLRVAEAVEGATVTAGVGRCYPGLRGLQRSYQEARRALALGRDMAPGGRTHFFGSLGVYPVLFPLWGTPDTEAFLEENLGRLLEYDQSNNTELARTLEVYFSCLGNLGQTSEALHLHRNSLSYRLRRIQEIAGLSLDDAEACFRLQLALKLRRLTNP